MNLVNRAVKGAAWAYIVFFGARFVTLGITIVLARLLVPEDFGLVGFALIFLTFIDAMRDFGIKDALIFNTEREEEAAQTAFWMTVGLGLVQYGFAFALAPLATHLVEDSRIVWLVRVMSLSLVINAFGGTHDALLQKELRFRKRYMPYLYAAVVKGVIAVAFAVGGMGYWSLAAGHLTSVIVQNVIKWFQHPFRPKLAFHMDRARLVWGFGIHIIIFDSLSLALEQADQFVIGVFIGTVQLGYWTIAARIPEMVIANFSIVLTRVIFPTYAKMKDNIEQLTEGFLITTKFTTYVTIPAGFGIASVAPELVSVVFGEQWEPAVDLVRVLALLGMATTLPWSAGDVFKAIGRPDLSTRLLIVESLYTFPLIWIVALQTREAVLASAANLAAMCITVVLRLGLASYYLKFSPLRYFNVFGTSFFAAIAMAAALTGWRVTAEEFPDILVLASSIVIGGVMYVGILLMLERDSIMQGIGVLRGAMQGPGEDDEEWDDADLSMPQPVKPVYDLLYFDEGDTIPFRVTQSYIDLD